jgi:hypothetical protein
MTNSKKQDLSPILPQYLVCPDYQSLLSDPDSALSAPNIEVMRKVIERLSPDGDCPVGHKQAVSVLPEGRLDDQSAFAAGPAFHHVL